MCLDVLWNWDVRGEECDWERLIAGKVMLIVFGCVLYQCWGEGERVDGQTYIITSELQFV